MELRSSASASLAGRFFTTVLPGCAAVSNAGVLERWIVRGLGGLVSPFPLHYLLQRQESFQVRDKF